jgi:hypothetical protein
VSGDHFHWATDRRFIFPSITKHSTHQWSLRSGSRAESNAPGRTFYNLEVCTGYSCTARRRTLISNHHIDRVDLSFTQ